MYRRALLVVVLLTVLVLSVGHRADDGPSVGFKPDFLPLSLSVAGSGVAVQGNTQLATPIGTFSIATHYVLASLGGDGIYLILRNRATGYDHVFDIHAGSDDFTAVINGATTVSVSNDQVLVDVTGGHIDRITFRHGGAQITQHNPPDWLQATWHRPFARWDSGYRQSWYHFYGMSRWAYSDTTIGQWYGIGFLWFLLRLTLAVVLALFDTFLSAGLLMGQISFVFFGPTGRDVSYGFLILAALSLTSIGVARLMQENGPPGGTGPARERAR